MLLKHHYLYIGLGVEICFQVVKINLFPHPT